MATISEEEEVIGNGHDQASSAASEADSTLQQLKAKKNKSNLFLIKSYSFIEKTSTNHNNNEHSINNNITNNNNNIQSNKNIANGFKNAYFKVSPVPRLQSPDMEPFPDIASLMLVAEEQSGSKKSRLKKGKKQKQSKLKPSKDGQKLEEQDEETSIISEQEAQLLRRDEMHASHGSQLPRPRSLPAKVHFEAANEATLVIAAQPSKRRSGHIKRESFLRQSLQSIRRSFSSNKHASKMSIATPNGLPVPASPASSNASSASTSTTSSCSSSTAISMLSKAPAHNHILDEFLPTSVVLLLNNDVHKQYLGQTSDRSSGSVACNNCGTDERLAAAQLAAAGQSGDNPRTAATVATLSEHQHQQQQQLHLLQLRRQQYAAQKLAPEHSSLPQTFNSYIGPLQTSESVQSLGSSPSPSPRNQSGKSESLGKAAGSNTAKQHEQQASAAAAISSTSAAAGASGSSSGINSAVANATGVAVAAAAPEKEKKRKEVSSSRVKKFHRHFSQVSKDETLINYFSCALVGDIPLQGHLYITVHHFAFYSNVFGYVTKVVIPTSSVTKISKEKTVKIIPNAVGVATADERHVFGSFISRESAYRLMCTVCSHLATGGEIVPKPIPPYVDLTEEYMVDDDSSCSISGNESPPHLRHAAAGDAATIESEPQMLLRERAGSDRHSDLQSRSSLNLGHPAVTIRSSAPPIVHYDKPASSLGHLVNGAGSRSTSASASTSASPSAASSSGPPSSSSSPITVVGVAAPSPPAHTLSGRLSGLAYSARSHLGWRLPPITELHVLYMGIGLAILLALFSVFLFYRILNIEAKTSLYRTPVDFNLRSSNDEDIFAEALRWQKELQDKSTAEAQHILTRNLEQISKVRRSLETLSMLIHDRRAGLAQPQTSAGMGTVSEMEMAMDSLPEPDLASQRDVSD